MAILATVAAVAIAVLALAGGDEKSPAGDPVAIARYCGLAEEFDRIVPDTASGAGSADASPEAIGQSLGQMGGTVAEMKATAPAEIRLDVAATVKAVQEAAGGDLAAIRSDAFRAQRQRVAIVRQRVCMVGADSGD